MFNRTLHRLCCCSSPRRAASSTWCSRQQTPQQPQILPPATSHCVLLQRTGCMLFPALGPNVWHHQSHSRACTRTDLDAFCQSTAQHTVSVGAIRHGPTAHSRHAPISHFHSEHRRKTPCTSTCSTTALC